MAINSIPNWVKYFSDSVNDEKGKVFDLVLEPFSGSDQKVRELTGSIPNLVDLVQKSEETLFLLVPAKGKKVRIVHSCFVSDPLSEDPDIIGIAGTQMTSPFKAMSAKQLTRSVKSKAKTRGKASFTPGPGDFDDIQSTHDFMNLKGNKMEYGINNTDEIPNCFVVHPSFFVDHSGGKPINAAVLAVAIINDSAARMTVEINLQSLTQHKC